MGVHHEHAFALFELGLGLRAFKDDLLVLGKVVSVEGLSPAALFVLLNSKDQVLRDVVIDHLGRVPVQLVILDKVFFLDLNVLFNVFVHHFFF